ncbi:hypothetical protein Tco_1506883 [Tanacetum coccineum]
MLTRAIAKQLSAALAHECLFVDFLSEKEPKKVSEALKHPGWVDAMQDELNQFAKNKIKQSERGISINQEKYVKDLLKKYDINGSSVKTPMVPLNNLGPDLNGKSINETRYLKGTFSLGLWYPKCSSFDLKGYLNSDYAGCNMDRKSTSGAFFHSRTKHVDIRYHFFRDHILKGDIELHFIPTQYQLVDIFTKPLDEPTFKRLIVELGMLNIDSKPKASALTKEN